MSFYPENSTTSSSTVPQTVNVDEKKSTLWMGELNPWVDEASVSQLWSSLGFQDVVVKFIRDKYTGVSQGYCFVDFGNFENARNALSYNGSIFPNSNKIFKLNWSSGGGLQDRKEDRPPEFSIFVGDLPPDTTEEQLIQLFRNNYPSCKTAKIMTDPVTGASRCYGFVRFSNEQEQQRSISEMQGLFCGNRAMRISLATPKNQNRNAQVASLLHQQQFAQVQQQPPQVQVQQQQQQQVLPIQSLNNTQQYNNFNNNNIQQQQQQQQSINQFTDPNNKTIFVGGLSSYVSEDELRGIFSGFGEITYVKIPPGKGCGFVQFVSRQSAELAISQMHGYPVGNSRIRLSWGRSQNLNQQQQQVQQLQQQQIQQQINPMMGGDSNINVAGAYRTMVPVVQPNYNQYNQFQGTYYPYQSQSPQVHPLYQWEQQQQQLQQQVQQQQQQQQQQQVQQSSNLKHTHTSSGISQAQSITNSSSSPTTTSTSAITSQAPLVQTPTVQSNSNSNVNVAGTNANANGGDEKLNDLYLAARDGRLDNVNSF